MHDADRDITAEVAALEADIRHHVIDLEVAFSTRDWALVARIYRNVAALADRLETIDPAARSRALERLELEQRAREEAFAGDDDPLLDEFESDQEAGAYPGDADRPGEREPGGPHDGRGSLSPWRPR